MARKSVEVRRYVDSCVKVVAHSHAKTFAAKTEDGTWLVWGEVPVAHGAEAENDLEADSYSLPRPVELKLRESDVQSIAINDAGVMYMNDHGELFQTLIDFEEVGQHQVVITTSDAVLISLPVSNPIQQFCCGDDFTLLLTRSGQVFSFGEGTHGQLGHGDLLVREQPTLVESLRRLTIGSIAVGSHHCLAYCDNDDCIYTWGTGSRGQLGHGRPAADSSTPRKIELEGADTSYVTLCCGRETSGAVTADGKAYVWGSNSHRQLGLSTTKDVLVPTRAELHVTDIAQLVLGEGMGIACTRDQRVFGWGSKLLWADDADGAPTLIMTQSDFGRQTGGSTVTSIALLGRQLYCHTADQRLVRCFPSIPADSVASTNPRLLKLAVLVFGHVHTFERLATARAWQKWRHQLLRSRPNPSRQLKACAVRMLVSMLKTSQSHRLRKCWSRWRDEAQEQRVTARMEAITSEYQTSLHQMRRRKSDLQDAMQQYRADVRSKELKLSKTIGAKRIAAIAKLQLTRRIRSAFERWRLVSSYATEVTQMRNEKYKLEIGMYQLTTQQKVFQETEAQTRRMQITLAAVTAFYRWKLGGERWKMQLMQEEFQAERAAVMKELHGLLAQIEKVNMFEREAVAAARARGASLVHDLFVARKILQDTKEPPTKPQRQGSNGAPR